MDRACPCGSSAAATGVAGLSPRQIATLLSCQVPTATPRIGLLPGSCNNTWATAEICCGQSALCTCTAVPESSSTTSACRALPVTTTSRLSVKHALVALAGVLQLERLLKSGGPAITRTSLGVTWQPRRDGASAVTAGGVDAAQGMHTGAMGAGKAGPAQPPGTPENSRVDEPVSKPGRQQGERQPS